MPTRHAKRSPGVLDGRVRHRRDELAAAGMPDFDDSIARDPLASQAQ